MKTKQTICSIIALLLVLSSVVCIAPEMIPASAAEMIGMEEGAIENELPAQYCMRDEYIVYAQTQDKHGFCWNFAATMAASTTLMKATNEYYDFSELWTGVALNTCTTSYNQIGAGGSFSNQYNAMKQSGLMLESDLPYQYSYYTSDENAEDYYNFYEKHSNDDLASTLVYNSDTSYSRKEVDEIKNHIYNHGSVYLAFSFRTGFIEKDGAFALEPNQKNTNSSHAVSVIGWDDNFQREYYFDGATTPTVFKGAWIILNSYTETNGNDGISLIFYDDNNVSGIYGYKYEQDTSKDLYFYDKIESGANYTTNLKGKYYGDFTAEQAPTKQKNIFYDRVNLEYSYKISSGASVTGIEIFLDGNNVTDRFKVEINHDNLRFNVSSKGIAAYGQYKMLVHYGNGEKEDTYLNNFFVTHGLVGEEIDYDSNALTIKPNRDLEFFSFISSNKNYVIYTNTLSGEISFLPTEQSVYSEKNMSIPKISYQITDGKSCTRTYTIKSNSGYELTYYFTFEYYEDTSLQPVNVFYDLGGGVNHRQNYRQELASTTKGLMLYAPTRAGYTFDGWYLDYGNGSKAVERGEDGNYYIDWNDIHHMGENPKVRALSYYQEHYKNSNTVFVYARWKEEPYRNVQISIQGNGTSSITEQIKIWPNDSVRYFLKPKSGNALSEVKINGVPLSSDELVEVIKHGLVVKGKELDRDTIIDVTFSEGVYLSLKFGENVKTAYVVGTLNGVATKFYDGDFIPSAYFQSYFRPTVRPTVDNVFNDSLVIPTIRPIEPSKDALLENLIKDDIIFDSNRFLLTDYCEADTKSDRADFPSDLSLLLPGSGKFSLVVEVFDDEDGHTYVIDDATSYTSLAKGIFAKEVVINSRDQLEEINVGSATKIMIEDINVSYSVNSYVQDHYLSTDINATSGDKNTATYEAGQIVYLFVKPMAENVQYQYTLPKSYASLNNGWYRRAICVGIDDSNLGEIPVTRELQTYRVTWKNWDGKTIYYEDCPYGSTPVFNNKYYVPSDVPTRPGDELYKYTFTGWDKEIKAVTADVSYTATYEASFLEYTVTVEPTENGTVIHDGGSVITPLDEHTYIFVPAPGYQVKDVILNGQSLGPISHYTFSKTYGNQTLRVEFEKIKCAINVICGENGSTDLGGILQIDYDSTLTIHITPSQLFGIDFIKVDGVPVEISETLTVNNVTKDTIVEIGFKQTVFQITMSNSENGTVTPSMTVSFGDSARVDFRAKFGYKVKDVIIDGVSVGAVGSYTFVDVRNNHEVFVEFELDVWLIVILSVLSALLLSGIVVILVILIRKTRKKKLAAKALQELADAESTDQEETTDQEEITDQKPDAEEKE